MAIGQAALTTLGLLGLCLLGPPSAAVGPAIAWDSGPPAGPVAVDLSFSIDAPSPCHIVQVLRGAAPRGWSGLAGLRAPDGHEFFFPVSTAPPVSGHVAEVELPGASNDGVALTHAITWNLDFPAGRAELWAAVGDLEAGTFPLHEPLVSLSVDCDAATPRAEALLVGHDVRIVSADMTEGGVGLKFPLGSTSAAAHLAAEYSSPLTELVLATWDTVGDVRLQGPDGTTTWRRGLEPAACQLPTATPNCHGILTFVGGPGAYDLSADVVTLPGGVFAGFIAGMDRLPLP